MHVPLAARRRADRQRGLKLVRYTLKRLLETPGKPFKRDSNPDAPIDRYLPEHHLHRHPPPDPERHRVSQENQGGALAQARHHVQGNLLVACRAPVLRKLADHAGARELGTATWTVMPRCPYARKRERAGPIRSA